MPPPPSAAQHLAFDACVGPDGEPNPSVAATLLAQLEGLMEEAAGGTAESQEYWRLIDTLVRADVPARTRAEPAGLTKNMLSHLLARRNPSSWSG